VEWKAVAVEEFPTEDVKEQVIFASFFERGFNLPLGISFAACCTTTSWSWYTLSPTPSLWFRPSFTFVMCIWDITSLLVVDVFFMCEEHWQEVGASEGCNVLVEVGPQDRVDR
jgi:hypothetical protein